MMKDLPPEPRILDIGCGPGVQTMELLRLSAGTVVALDLLPKMIERVTGAAEEAGFSGRLETVQADMNEMSFEPESFDVVWSEGAIYFLGFEKGLGRVKELVRPGGYVAVSESVWLKTDPPREVVELWEAYPEIDTVERKLEIVSRLGYELSGHFILPASSWTDQYYDPLASRIPDYEKKWKGIPDAESVLEEARTEVAIYEKYPDYYSYAFFVMRKP
jgi:SAM-dependent methyltransferase